MTSSPGTARTALRKRQTAKAHACLYHAAKGYAALGFNLFLTLLVTGFKLPLPPGQLSLLPVQQTVWAEESLAKTVFYRT